MLVLYCLRVRLIKKLIVELDEVFENVGLGMNGFFFFYKMMNLEKFLG